MQQIKIKQNVQRQLIKIISHSKSQRWLQALPKFESTCISIIQSCSFFCSQTSSKVGSPSFQLAACTYSRCLHGVSLLYTFAPLLLADCHPKKNTFQLASLSLVHVLLYSTHHASPFSEVSRWGSFTLAYPDCFSPLHNSSCHYF